MQILVSQRNPAIRAESVLFYGISRVLQLLIWQRPLRPEKPFTRLSKKGSFGSSGLGQVPVSKIPVVGSWAGQSWKQAQPSPKH